MRRFYTIDDLHTFCKTNHFEKFSSVDLGAPLIVQSFGTFEAADNITDGLMTVKLKSCHTGKNRNNSGISDETMVLYKDSFKGRPILGAIYKTDTGEYEFRAHDMEIVEDGDGVDINYIEQPIGVISQTTTPYLEYDEDAKKNYLMVEGTIFADYSKAAEILERRRTCKCSVEIAVEEMSYNCSEDYLSIDKFHFTGVTILGYQQDGTTEIQEGMAGSKITIDDFSVKHNSMFTNNYQDKMIEVLEKLNATLSNFNKESDTKGGNVEMNKFEELLEKYGKTAEDVTFDIEGLSDEELEAKFAEAFENDNNDGADTEDDKNTDVDSFDDDSTNDEDSSDDNSEEDAKSENKFVLQYELSHDDIRSALYSLLAATSEDKYYYTWIIEVYDNKFIYQDYEENKFYRQGYTKDGDTVALDENKVEVFNEWLSQAEKDALNTLKDNYAALETQYNELKAFKDNYDAAELKAQKDAIFAREEYSVLAEDEAFKTLVSDAAQFTVEEVEAKAKAIFADHVIKAGTFSAKNNDESNKPKTIGFNFNKKPNKKSTAYGGLFDK